MTNVTWHYFGCGRGQLSLSIKYILSDCLYVSHAQSLPLHRPLKCHTKSIYFSSPPFHVDVLLIFWHFSRSAPRFITFLRKISIRLLRLGVSPFTHMCGQWFSSFRWLFSLPFSLISFFSVKYPVFII